MAMINNLEGNKFQINHLSIPTNDTQDHSTIYKLRLSMKKRLTPKQPETPSPEGAGELQCLLQRLVEIDTESRELLIKVFSMLGKDEKLEKYVNNKIKDPKVSRMWQLVEQVLDCQGEGSNLGELIRGDDGVKDKGFTEAEEMEEDMKLDKFRVRTLDTGVKGGENSSATHGN